MKQRFISLVEDFLDGDIDLQALAGETGMLLSTLRRHEKAAMLLAGSILGPITEHSLGHRSDTSLRAALEDVVAPLTTGTNMAPLLKPSMIWGAANATATSSTNQPITMPW